MGVVSSSGAPVPGARVQRHGGVWREAGVTGVDGLVRFETWDQTIPVQVTVDGRTKRIDQNVGVDPRLEFALTEVSVGVVSSSGAPVPGARVQWYGGVWREAGVTGVDGLVRFETWDQTIPVQVTRDGRTKRIDQNVGVDPRLEFALTEVSVGVVSSSGAPVPGARVQWYGGVWREAGVTGVDGLVRFETWDQTIPVQVTLDGRTHRKDPNVARTPEVVFTTMPLPENIVGDTVGYYSGQWRTYRPGDEFLPGALTLRRIDGTTHTVTLVEPERLPDRRLSPSPEPTPQATPRPTAQPTPQQTATPGDAPTPQPTLAPSAEPTPRPTVATDGETPAEDEPTPGPAEPSSEPGDADSDDDAPQLVLDLPRSEPTATTSPDGTPLDGSTDGAPTPPEGATDPSPASPPADTDAAPSPFEPTPLPADGPDSPDLDDDDLVVVIRPVIPPGETEATDTVAFDLEVTNQGLRRAEAPVVVDVDLGSSLTLTTVDSEAWRCSHETATLRCISAEPIDPGAGSTIAVTAQPARGGDAAPEDLAMAADASTVSVTTGDEVGSPAAAGTEPVAVSTVRVVSDGRSRPTDTLVLLAVLAVPVAIWSWFRRRRAAT